jgi:HD-GYP domain-containing protein (c-di-GMP phosphodiesterase class II)
MSSHILTARVRLARLRWDGVANLQVVNLPQIEYTASVANPLEEIERRNRRLTRLVELSVTLNSTLDLDALLQLVTATASELLECEAASILLYNEKQARLYFAAATGSDPKKLAEIPVPLEHSLAGTIFRENRPVILNHAEGDARHFPLASEHVNFHVHSLVGVPMLIKERVIGVLEAVNKREGLFGEQDQAILSVTASHAAIAIGNAQLFREVERSNADLRLAYDATIAGWSRALDLRDHDTDGHTQRVADMTVRLARAFGLGEQAVVQIRRGALLHDMGKLGVPDAILLKPGRLTKAERKLMLHHPQYAYEMLSPIAYLRLALDIPRCHHEKWDGSGYPRGLAGEEIPLAARLFAVVDVWDALSNNRPYRKQWPQEKTLEYIRSQSGKHFDPCVVEVFLRLLREGA